MGNCANKGDRGVAHNHRSYAPDDAESLSDVNDRVNARLHRRGQVARAHNAKRSKKEKRSPKNRDGTLDASAAAATPARAAPPHHSRTVSATPLALPTTAPPSPPPDIAYNTPPPPPPQQQRVSGTPAPPLLTASAAATNNASTSDPSPAHAATASDPHVLSLDSVAVRLEQGSTYVWLRQSYTNPHLAAKPLMRLGGLRQLRNRDVHFQQLWAVLGEAACMIGPYAAAAAAAAAAAPSTRTPPSPPQPPLVQLLEEPRTPLKARHASSAVYDDNTPSALGLDKKSKAGNASKPNYNSSSSNGGGGGGGGSGAGGATGNVSQSGSPGAASLGRGAVADAAWCAEEVRILSQGHASIEGDAAHTHPLLCRGAVFRDKHVWVHNLRHRCCFVLEAMSSVDVHACTDSLLVLGPTAGAVSLSSCRRCCVIAAAGQVRLLSCESVLVSMTVTGLPVIEKCAQIGVAPLLSWYAYNDLPAQLRHAHLSPFTNNYSTIRDATPPAPPPTVPPLGPLGMGMLPPGAPHRRSLSASMSSGSVTPSPTPQSNFVYLDLWELEAAVWKTLAEQRWAQLIAEAGSADALEVAAAMASTEEAPLSRGGGGGGGAAGRGDPLSTVEVSGVEAPLRETPEAAAAAAATAQHPLSGGDVVGTRVGRRARPDVDDTPPPATAATPAAEAPIDRGVSDFDFGAAEGDFRSMVSFSHITASTTAAAPSSTAATRTPHSSQLKGTSQSTNVSSGSGRITGGTTAGDGGGAAGVVKGDPALLAATAPHAAPHPHGPHQHHLISLPRWRQAGFAAHEQDAMAAVAASSGTSSPERGAAAAAVRVRSSAQAAERLVRAVLRAVPLLPLSALPQAVAVLTGTGGESDGGGGAQPATTVSAEPQPHETGLGASEEARAPHGGSGAVGSPASTAASTPTLSPRDHASAPAPVADGSGGRASGRHKKHRKKSRSGATADEWGASSGSPESPQLVVTQPIAVAGAAVTPLQLPATNPLELLLAFYTHACAVPATFGAQLIPADFFEQRWKLKLMVLTNKSGGWELAHRITRDIEEGRRQAMLETLRALLHAPPPPLRREREDGRSASAGSSQGAAAAAPHPPRRRSSSRETTSTPPTVGGDDDEDSFTEALYTYLRATSLTQRCGPVLLLNTVELRCTETAVREFVAPVFYKLCEPAGLSSAAAQASAGAKAPAKRGAGNGSNAGGSSGSGGGGGGGGGVGGIKLPWKHSSNPTTPSHAAAAAAAAETEQNVEVRRLFGSALQRMSGQTCVALLALVAPKALPPSFQRPPAAGGRSSGGALTPPELAAWAQRAEQARRIFTPQPDPPDSSDDGDGDADGAEAARGEAGHGGIPRPPKAAALPSSRGPTFRTDNGQDAAAGKFFEERAWSKSVVLNVTVPTRFISLLQSTLFFKSQLLLASSAADVQRA